MPGRRLLAPTAALLALLMIGPAQAAFEEPAAADVLSAARAHIKAKRWTAAVAELKSINARSNADWNNLMGFALRKSTPPDLAQSEAHYDEALRINPQHRGALEYSGELYLMKGDLPKAEQRLSALEQACAAACEEYLDLKKSIELYKANGNRQASSY
jgi:tetratricopeptide (TPR) repeat protein